MKRSHALVAGLLACAAGFAGWTMTRPAEAPRVARPDTVTIAPGPYAWRPSGTWTRDGEPADPPLQTRTAAAPLEIMTHHVTRDAWQACVADGACPDPGIGEGNAPQVLVSWREAGLYAAWLSEGTGETWRLPTEEEWQRAAAERFVDDATIGENSDPGERLLAAYERNISGRLDGDAMARDSIAPNSHGVADLGGNIWEWTSTCQVSGRIEGDRVIPTGEACVARVAAGQHRAIVLDFVRDARAGGCGAGVPPDYLGFRLVRDTQPLS